MMPGADVEVGMMRKLLLCMILVAATPAWSQTKPAPRAAASRVVDPCAPIGQTASRELIYSMSCNKLPAPPPLPQAEIQPAPEPEAQRGGFLGLSFDRTGGPGGARNQ
jgi:hypothetical protein